jgi:transcription elongation factor Elf1
MSGSDKIHALIAKKSANRQVRALTKQELKRLKKLELYITCLKCGENVQNRTLQTWLTVDEFDEIGAMWAEQKELRSELNEKNDEIKQYEKLLHKGIFAYNRADSFSSKGKSDSARRMFNDAEAKCEVALEYLQEIIMFDPQLQVWFDRDVYNTPENNISSSSPVSMPRVVTSRSLDRQTSYSGITSKIDVKLSVVERVIEKLKRD